MPEIPETHADLIARSQIVTLATEGADGYPQVSATWFLIESDTIKASLNETRQKVKNMVRNPRVALLFIDPDDEYRTVEIRANATVEPDAGNAFAAKVGAKYGIADMSAMDRPGEGRVVVTFQPVRVNTFG
jgi:PPOX class probable F420-dependent enzyme